MQSQAQPQQSAINIVGSQAPGHTTIGGIVTLKSNAQMERERIAAISQNNQPEVQNLASYIRDKAIWARWAKEQTVEQRMLASVRYRRMEYMPDKLAQLKEQGSADIFMGITSNKCRAASSWLRDVLVTVADELPFDLEPDPVPDMRPDLVQDVMQQAQSQLAQMYMSGQKPSPPEVREMLLQLKDQAMSQLTDLAAEDADRMKKKMESQLLDGGWIDSFTQFLDDIVTFPAAFLKGPIVRRRPKLKWVQAGKDWAPAVVDELKLEWERVSPFNIYPAPDADTVQDGWMIERHHMSREDLIALKGVEGYSDGAIDQVLDEYGRGGLRDWWYIDLTRQTAEGKSTIAAGQNPSQLIDALQFWGSVQGRHLIEWGMSKDEIRDPMAEYPIEAWLVGRWVIRAILNPDPLGRRPYYKASYEEIPGAFWGNSVADLCRDTQDICNAAARALVNNMSLASGPQVVYNVDRLPAGENITHLFPWKIWQVTSDPYAGSTQPPMQFFQPNSMAQELLMVYEKFATLADEYTGIPRYMTGDSPSGGAGRTASGMSMLMSNAGKSIKQVIANIDEKVIQQVADRLYYFNMRYSEDTDLKGAVNVRAKGAQSLMQKEAAQQRQMEFLQIVLQSPVAQQIVGQEGAGNLLRQLAKTLDMNVDDIVPPMPVLKQRLAQMQAQQQQLAQQANQQQFQEKLALAEVKKRGYVDQGGTPPSPQNQMDQNKLQGGAPVVNRFQPMQAMQLPQPAPQLPPGAGMRNV